MKKEGFTLVELLAVVVIIGITYLIIFPSVTSFIDKSKEKSYNIQVDLIEKASKKWGVDNTDELLKKDPYHLNNINLTLTTLKKEGYLQDMFIENPKNKKIKTYKKETVRPIKSNSLKKEKNSFYSYTFLFILNFFKHLLSSLNLTLLILRKNNIKNNSKHCCRNNTGTAEDQADRLWQMHQDRCIGAKSITKTKCYRNDRNISRSDRPLGD